MVGGMVTAPLLSMFVVPALFRLLRKPGSFAGDTPTLTGSASPPNPVPTSA
jgi:Cu(I)/Ag(I) efflux system membrane protein CusA/SilA